MTVRAVAESVRRTARMFASGVVIVAAGDGQVLIAKTVSAFHTLSMEPPLASGFRHLADLEIPPAALLRRHDDHPGHADAILNVRRRVDAGL